ncbi:MAG: 30S ribosomal protein S20 [Deltaproteobacteria bacterium]|nr:30S ribosomal protein S20 [Deltaproteobacteria bacterium]
MANHSSAEKRNRQRIVRTLRNRSITTGVRTLVKKVRAAIAKGDTVAAEEALKSATSHLDSAVSKGVMHRRTASRSISRLNASVVGAKKA